MFICYLFQFKFGDMSAIEFPSVGNLPLPLYIHWALYIGKGQVEGLKDVKTDDEDIFYVYGKQTYSRLQDFLYSVKKLVML